MSAKRTHSDAFEEFDDVSSVTHTSPNAKIHCVVSKVPEKMRKGKGSDYFDGRLSDGNKTIRVFGYDPEARKRLFNSQQQPPRTVLLSGCTVKTEKYGNDLEVFVNKSTTVKESSKSFSVPDQKPQDKVSITSTANLKINSKVTVEATVVSKEEPGFIETKQIRIQEMKIADASGSIRLTVWADIVDTLKLDHSYHLQDVTVREFRGKRFLSTSPITKVTPINNIGTVEVLKDDFDDPAKHLIISTFILYFNHLISCYYSNFYL